MPKEDRQQLAWMCPLPRLRRPLRCPLSSQSPKVTSLRSALAQSFNTTPSPLFISSSFIFKGFVLPVPTRHRPVNLTCPDHANLGSAPVKRHYLGRLEASLSPVSLIGPCALAIWTQRHRVRTSQLNCFELLFPAHSSRPLKSSTLSVAPIHCIDNCDRRCNNVYPLSIPHFADCERPAGSQ